MNISEVRNNVEFLLDATNNYVLVLDYDYTIVYASPLFENDVPLNLYEKNNFLKRLNFQDEQLFQFEKARTNTSFEINSVHTIRKDSRHITWRFKRLTSSAAPLAYIVLGIDNTDALLAQENKLFLTDFFTFISKELRNPLHSIIGFSELVKNPTLDPHKINMFKNIVVKNSKRMRYLLGNILDISFAKSNQLVREDVVFSVSGFMDEVLHEFRSKLSDTNIELYVKNNIPDKFLEVVADRKKIYKTVTHLVANAVSNTNSGFIIVSCSLEYNALIITIKDSGRGMNKNELDQINEELHSKYPKFNKGILGVGLRLVYAYISFLGGKFNIDSEPDKGTVVTVSVPVSLYRSDVVESVGTKLEIDYSSKTVLMIGDFNLQFDFIHSVLNETKSTVFSVNNGLEAMELILSGKVLPQLIVIDFATPDKLTQEITSRIARLYGEIPIVAVSPFKTKELEKIAIETGCLEFVFDSNDSEKFHEILKDHLS